jgi:hypothetical protein
MYPTASFKNKPSVNLTVAVLINEFFVFMESRILIPFSQEPNIGLYPEIYITILLSHNRLFKFVS